MHGKAFYMFDITLRQMSLAKLVELKDEVEAEIVFRRTSSKPSVSIKINSKKRFGAVGSSWFKVVTGIDITKRGTEEFLGPLICDGKHDVPYGTLILEVWALGQQRGAALWEIVGPNRWSLLADSAHWPQEAGVFREKVCTGGDAR